MTKEQHERAGEIFLSATELEGEAREAYLVEACAGDSALLAEVRDLLQFDDRSHYLDRSLSLSQPTLDVVWEQAEAAHPTSIGSFEILGVLGEGGMGTVYRARQAQPAREVALKVMRAGFGSTALQQRFELEAHVLGLLQDPGIAQVYEAGTADGGSGPQPYFAMELVDGRPLTTYGQERDLSTRDKLRLLQQVCEAVHHAHQRGIIHRDLKPDNVLVTAQGQPKVLDFGIARAAHPELSTTVLQTETGQIMGTLPYMSPEQLSGQNDLVDIRTDVYALGVMGYEWLAGRLPLDLKDKPLAKAAKIVADEVPAALGTVHKSFRGDIETIFGKALAKEKERRYDSAAALAQDIARHLASEPILARPPSLRYQLSSFTKRNRVLVAGASSTFLAVVIGMAVALWMYFETDRARKTAVKEQKNSQDVVRFFTHDVLAAVKPENTANKEITMREVFEAAAANLDERYPDQPEVEIAIRGAVGSTFSALGKFDLAQEQYERALQIVERVHPDDHPDRPLTLNNLGLTELRRGQYAKALPYLEQAWELGDKNLRPDNSERGTILSNLAQVYGGLGQCEKSAKFYRKALAVKREHYGPKHFETTRVMGGLAMTHLQLGDPQSARPLMEEVLAINIETLGLEHPDVLIDHNNLGNLLLDLDEPEAARDLLEPAVQRAREVYDEGHPSLVYLLGALAGAYGDLGRDDLAVEYRQEALAISRAVNGPESANTLTVMNNLARNLRATGKVAEAQEMLAFVWEARKRTLGEDHPLTWLSAHNLGLHHMKTGANEAAEPLLRSAYEAYLERFGNDYPRTVVAQSNLGYLLATQGKPTDGLLLLEKACEFGPQCLPPDHWLIGLAQARRGAVLARMKRLEEARPFLEKGYELLQASQGDSSEHTRAAAGWMADYLEARGNAAEATPWRKRSEEPK